MTLLKNPLNAADDVNTRLSVSSGEFRMRLFKYLSFHLTERDFWLQLRPNGWTCPSERGWYPFVLTGRYSFCYTFFFQDLKSAWHKQRTLFHCLCTLQCRSPIQQRAKKETHAVGVSSYSPPSPHIHSLFPAARLFSFLVLLNKPVAVWDLKYAHRKPTHVINSWGTLKSI